MVARNEQARMCNEPVKAGAFFDSLQKARLLLEAENEIHNLHAIIHKRVPTCCPGGTKLVFVRAVARAASRLLHVGCDTQTSSLQIFGK